MKYLVRFNYYGCRNKQINKGRAESKCPQCQQIKDWTHIIKSKAYDSKIKQDLIQNIANNIKKVPEWDKEERVIVVMLKDIHNYLLDKGMTKSM